MTNREARALLLSCDTTQRERESSTTRDLLTEPRWGKWEGAPENAPLDARDVRVPIHTARPQYTACWAAWGIGGFFLLVLVGMALQAAGWGG